MYRCSLIFWLGMGLDHPRTIAHEPEPLYDILRTITQINHAIDSFTPSGAACPPVKMLAKISSELTSFLAKADNTFLSKIESAAKDKFINRHLNGIIILFCEYLDLYARKKDILDNALYGINHTDIDSYFSEFAKLSRHVYRYLDEFDFYGLLNEVKNKYPELFSDTDVEQSCYSKVLLGLFHDDVSVADKFFERIKGKKGTKVVNEIIALREIGKMKGENEVTGQLLFYEISNICNIGVISTFRDAFIYSSDKTKIKRTAAIEEAKNAY